MTLRPFCCPLRRSRRARRSWVPRFPGDFDGREPLFVGVLKGCFVFMADLMRSVTIPCSVDFMAVSSHGNQTTTTGAVKINKDLNQDIEAATSFSLRTFSTAASRCTISRTISVSAVLPLSPLPPLLDKPARRKAPIHAAYAGFEVPDAFVVGYGLDYAEKYRSPVYRRAQAGGLLHLSASVRIP